MLSTAWTRAALAWAALACCGPSVARATPVLSPSAGERIGSLLQDVAQQTGQTLERGAIRADHVTAQFCASARCVEATLVHGAGCGEPAGEFCITWSGGTAPVALDAALRRALQQATSAPLWQQPATTGVDARLQAALRSYRPQVRHSWDDVDALSSPSFAMIASVTLAWVALAAAFAVWLLRRRAAAGPAAAPSSAVADHVQVDSFAATRFALAVAAAWIAVALGVHHAFPFYAMDMYSGVYTSGSQVAVLDAQDRPHSPRAFGHWRCPPLPSGTDLPRTDGVRLYSAVDSRDRLVLEHVRAAPPPPTAAPSMRLVRRIWRFEDGAVVMTDLPIATCQVAP